MNNDLKNSMNRLFEQYKIYNDEERYAAIYCAIKDIFNNLSEIEQDAMRTMLMDEGIKRIAGI